MQSRCSLGVKGVDLDRQIGGDGRTGQYASAGRVVADNMKTAAMTVNRDSRIPLSSSAPSWWKQKYTECEKVALHNFVKSDQDSTVASGQVTTALVPPFGRGVISKLPSICPTISSPSLSPRDFDDLRRSGARQTPSSAISRRAESALTRRPISTVPLWRPLNPWR